MCEKCLHTTRCLLRIEEQSRARPSDPQEEDSSINQITESLRQAHYLLENMLKDRGIELSPHDMQESRRKELAIREQAEQETLVVLATEYAHRACRWLERGVSGATREFTGEESTADTIRISRSSPISEEGLTAIQWYVGLIPTKIQRAVTGRVKAQADTFIANIEHLQ